MFLKYVLFVMSALASRIQVEHARKPEGDSAATACLQKGKWTFSLKAFDFIKVGHKNVILNVYRRIPFISRTRL